LATSWQASSSCVHALVRQGLIPQVTADQFTYRLKRLAQSFRARGHDLQELEQDLLVILVNAIRHYKPDGAPRQAYLKAALNRGYCEMCRRLKAECRKRANACPLGAHEPQPPRRESFDAEALQQALATLSDDDHNLAKQLGVMSPAQIARVRGVHRGTALREAQRLRWAFRSVME
jgi:DNA-directed RNA polymerase specialized sigma24 family protein